MAELLKSYDPSNGEFIGQVDITDTADIDTLVQRSKVAQKKWQAIGIEQRVAYIEAFGQLLDQRQNALGELLCREMGKNLRQGIGEVKSCAVTAASVAREVQEATRTLVRQEAKGETRLEHNPLGVCGIITPWNFPMSMIHWLAIPALAAGNTVVLKPSEETPLIAEAYVALFNEILPQDVLQVIYGGDAQGKALVTSDVQMIAFTGSQAVGKKIMKAASNDLKRLVLELGGNDPMIVLEDADMDAAVKFAVGNSFFNAGQMCVATERVYVDSKIANTFEQKVKTFAAKYTLGPWDDEAARIGPIINYQQRQLIIDHIQDAIDKGANVLYGDSEHPTRYIHPTVLSNMNHSMRMFKEETFGPVVAIGRFNSIDEAISMANDSELGLGAVVFGYKDAEYVASQLEAGMVGVNQGVGTAASMPWVGAKQSGYGYHGSPEGHRQFTQVRVITITK